MNLVAHKNAKIQKSNINMRKIHSEKRGLTIEMEIFLKKLP